MIPLVALDAVTFRFARVSASDRLSDLGPTAGKRVAYAVYSDARREGIPAPLLGLVLRESATQNPDTPFGDLVPSAPVVPLHERTPLTEVLRRLDSGTVAALPVIDDSGELKGVVTRGSAVRALMRRQADNLDSSTSGDPGVTEAAWQLSGRLAYLQEMAGACLNVMSLLDSSASQADVLHESLESLSAATLARYGAVAVFTDHGTIEDFVFTGISEEQARLIPRLPEGKGLLGIIGLEPEIVNIPDMSVDPRSAGFPPNHPPMRSLVAAAIAHDGRLYGRIYLCDKLNNEPFGAEDERLILNFARALALVVSQRREQAARKRAEMEGNALRRLAQRLMAPMPLRGVVEILAEETRNVFRHDAFRFDLYDPAREMLQGVYYEDTPEGGTEPVEVASDVSYRIRNAAAGLFEGRSVLVSREGVISSVDVVPFGFKSRLSQSLMFAPIRWQDKLVAVASVQNYTPGRYRQQDLRFFEALVGQCGAAVARAQAEEELRASRDKMQVMQLRYQAILRSTPNGLCIISPDWVIQFANHALHRILSPDLTTTQELVGYPFESFFTTAEEFREHLKSVTAAILDRGSDRRELELRRLDGSPFWGEISTVLLDPAEADSGYVATLAEISERREAEIALKRERDFTTAVIDTAGALVLVVNRHGQIIRFNRACEQASGYSFEEVRGKSFVSLFLKPGNPDEPAPFDEALSGLFPPNGESYWIMRDGRRRFFAWSSTVLLDDEGAVRYIIGIGVDRTEAKRQEEALVAAESKYRALVEQSLVGIYIIQDGRIVYANPKYAEVFGYTRDELMGLPSSLELIAPVDRALAAEHLRRRLQDTPDEGHHQLRGIRKDGRLIHVELHGSRTEFNGKPAIIGVMIDVTERERSEREREVLARLGLQVAGVRSVEQVGELALHAAEELWTLYSFYLSVRQNRPGLFRTIIAVRTQEAGSETFAPFDCEFSEDDGMPGFWGGEAVRIDRMPGDKGAWWCPFTLPSEEAWCSLLAPVNVRGQVVGSIAIQSRTAGYFDDRDRDLLKRLAGVFGRALERCQAQDENALLAATIAQASEAIAIADTTWVVRYVNPAFEQITGLRREQAEGVDFRGLLGSGTPQDPLFPEIESLLRRNEAWAGRIESRGAGDNTIHEEVSVTPIRNSRGKVGNYVIVRRDISREVNLEENLRQAQKMEALGLLAGGIAHDFNNLMHIIMGYCQLALRLGKPKPKVRDQLEGVVATVKRGAALTGQLLAFSHKHISQPQIVNVNHVVEEMLRMLERLIGEDIHLEASMQRDIGPVYIDPSQFEQVVMNLAVNARDAMDEGGILRVETASARLDAEYAKKHFDVEPGEYVMLVVSDTGRGMDPETASHLFEPFYTTKGIGRGTGLGMSMVYGIVKQAGGHIVIESLPRQGTTLRVYLPRADITGTVHEHPAIPEGPADGTETVLLVEDDVDVRALTRLMLVSRGYKVLEASDGREALSVAEQTDEPIHLLLTDVVMPNMGGVELAEQFARLHPQIPIVFMSGYTNNDLAEETIAAENLNFLQKPVDSDVLAEKLREVLDRRQDKA